MRLFTSFLAFALSVLFVAAQTSTPTQTVRGTMTDRATGEPLPFATVMIKEKPELGVTTDVDGRFEIKNVPVGRYTLQGRYVGYTTVELKEQMVSSGKELVVDIAMDEDSHSLSEVVVRVNKQMPVNQTAVIGARMFSTEEVSRMPGGVEDPARHVTNFAGVSGDGSSNGISIHGNAPHLLAYRIEGVEIPNPNHYADLSVMGGGLFSSLSMKVIGNSDFFTSAFPSEYNNAISGIFDMKLRNGNTQRHEHSFQAGVLGFDLSSEGPMGKKGSYIVNYRYSFFGLGTKLGFIDLNGQELDYQDLNFKFFMPTEKAGTFTLWGTGLIDNFISPVDEQPWDYLEDGVENAARQRMMATGLTHKYYFPSGASLKTTLAYSINTQKAWSEQEVPTALQPPKGGGLNRFFESHLTNSDIILTSAFNKRCSKHFTNTIGFTLTGLRSDMLINNSPTSLEPMERIVDKDNSTLYSSVYTNNRLSFGRFATNLGLSWQYLSFNKTSSVEPRVNMEYEASDRLRFAAGFGVHSRKERTDIYFVERDGKMVNSDLGFTRACHYTLGMTYNINENTMLKVEPYFQHLCNVPVEQGCSFSMLNHLAFLVDKDLSPDGEGRNVGVDITLERYMNQGWYGMLTGSLFSSKFKASDGKWYHSRYDRNYIVNLVGGKEWMLGSNKSKVLNISGKVTLQGAERTSPIDYEASLAHPTHEVQYVQSELYTQRIGFTPVFAFTASYKINRTNLAHTFLIDFVRSQSFYGYQYNLHTGEYDEENLSLAFPQIAYRVEF